MMLSKFHDKMSCLILLDQKSDIAVMNVYVSTEGEYDVKDSFYDELGHVSSQFCRYHMKV
jgi:hypothetical protein